MLVGECGMDPEYVNWKMDLYEARLVFAGARRKNLDNWRRTQLLGYILCQSNSKKKWKADDVVDLKALEESTKVKMDMNPDPEKMKKKEEKLENMKEKMLELAAHYQKFMN